MLMLSILIVMGSCHFINKHHQCSSSICDQLVDVVQGLSIESLDFESGKLPICRMTITTASTASLCKAQMVDGMPQLIMLQPLCSMNRTFLSDTRAIEMSIVSIPLEDCSACYRMMLITSYLLCNFWCASICCKHYCSVMLGLPNQGE